jgi:hypothetical protein
LLSRLEGCRFFAGSIFEIHPEPNWPYNDADDARTEILCNLQALLVSELLGFRIIGLDFGPNLSAGRGLILRLDLDRRTNQVRRRASPKLLL